MIDKKIVEFLTEPANLEAALDLEPVITEIKISVFQKFWDNVYGILGKWLAQGDYRWELASCSNLDDSRSELSIVDKKYPGDGRRNGGSTRLSFGYGCLTGRPERGHYGLKRAVSVKPVDVDASENQIIKQLEAHSLKQDESWSGYAYLDNAGIPEMNRSRPETVIALNLDNRSADLHLATRTAQLLWDIFKDCHSLVESFNDKWPYEDQQPH